MSPFDALYVINLRSRTDRRAQMRAQLRRVGLDPDAPPVVFFDAVRPDVAAGFPTLGARGCFLSHLGVLRDALAAGHRHILVVEDDLNFADDFAARFAQAVAAADRLGWDLWFLGALGMGPALPPLAEAAGAADAARGTSASPGARSRAPASSNEGPRVVVRTSSAETGEHADPATPAGHAGAPGDAVALPPGSVVLGTHMLALDACAIARLVPYLQAMLERPSGDPAGGPMHVDGAYSWFRRAHPDLRTVLATPPLGYQRPSRTDVHALRWFDRLPGLHRVAALLRRMRAGLR